MRMQPDLLKGALVAGIRDVHSLRKGVLLLLIAGVASPFAGPEAFVQVAFFGVFALALALARHSVGEDFTSGRYLMIFQRPVYPPAHYALKLLMGLFILCGVAATMALSASLAGSIDTPQHWVNPLFGFTMGGILLVTGYAMSSLFERHSLEVMLVLAFASMAQGLLSRVDGGHAIRPFVSWALLPIDPLFRTWTRWMNGTFSVDPRDALQAACFTGFWLLVLWLRTARADASGRGHF